VFLVYANQRGICKFSLLFNEHLDLIIKRKDSGSLKDLLLDIHTSQNKQSFLVNDNQNMFVELYDNPFLADEDREFIIRLISREIFATKLALQLLRKKILNFDKCTFETIASELDSPKETLSLLVAKCHNDVCIQDAKILSDDGARATMSKYENAPSMTYTIDKPKNSSSPQIYCFDTIDLIDSIVTTGINPKSGEPFSEYAVELITRRFNKEINMYRRYKQIKPR
jgi:hypothetical protein